jgi:putative tryptophan/tyrosine transport system substrate-binding protein
MNRPPSPLTMLLSRHTKRREFIAGLGSAAAWPLAARAQQPGMPVVGFLGQGTAAASQSRLVAVRQGLSEVGYVEGRNVAIESRFAEGQFDRLPALAADLVRHRVAVIVANGPPPARAARAQSDTIAIVFGMGEDPVKEGLVASLNRTGGNITGVSNFANRLLGKRMGLLWEIVPDATTLALLVNPNNPNAEPDIKDAQASADALGRQLEVLTAKTESDLDGAFAAIVQRQVGGLLVGIDTFFEVNREQLAALALRHGIPAVYPRRDYPDAGGLMSYEASTAEMYRQVGIYTGRILKGEKPADLPVQQATKFEFVINLKTAKAQGITIPPGMLALADEVIE